MDNNNENEPAATAGAFYRDCVISYSEDKTQCIYSDERQVRVVEASAGQSLLTSFESGMRGRIAWENHSIASDCEAVTPGAIWALEEDLVRLTVPARTHPYVLMTKNVNQFFSFLLRNTGTYTPVVLYGRHLIMGPRVSGAMDTCPACFSLSLLTNIPSLSMRYENEHAIEVHPESIPRCASALRSLVSIRESDTPKYPAQGILIYDLLTGEIVSEERAVALCGSCAESSSALFSPRLVNPEAVKGSFVGLIQKLNKVNARPKTLNIFVSSGQLLQKHQLGGGVHPDRELAKRKAVFETIERFTQSRLAAKATLASISELDHPAAPEDFTLFSEEQYAAPGMKYARFEKDKRYYWLEGTLLATRRPVFLPADFIGIDYDLGRHNNLGPLKSSGAAAHETFNKALTNSCLELLERDVVSRTWFKGAVRALDASLWAPSLEDRLLNEGLELRLWLSDDMSCGPVTVCAIVEKGTGLGALGTASGLNLSEAAISAVYNAATMFAYREQTGGLLRLESLAELGLKGAGKNLDDICFHFNKFVEKYEPAFFDLTDQNLKRAGIHVVSAWSPHAVDFPNSVEPLPLRKWRPTTEESVRLEKEKSYISGK